MLCHRGCGLPSTFTNKLGKYCCAPKAQSCPIIKKKIGERSGSSRKGKTYDELYGDNADKMRKLRSEKLTGRPVTEQSKNKSSTSNKQHRELHPRDPWNKGKIGVQVPWNKGKTGYTMPARRKISEEDYKDYQKYKRAVYSASRKTYNQHINLLNPDGLLLGRCGTPEAHQIDHKVPISIGYQLQIPVTVMAIIENLQLMTWKENLNKSNKQETNQEILNMLIEKTNYIKGLTT
jgi:hypothetical protein